MIDKKMLSELKIIPRLSLDYFGLLIITKRYKMYEFSVIQKFFGYLRTFYSIDYNKKQAFVLNNLRRYVYEDVVSIDDNLNGNEVAATYSDDRLLRIVFDIYKGTDIPFLFEYAVHNCENYLLASSVDLMKNRIESDVYDNHNGIALKMGNNSETLVERIYSNKTNRLTTDFCDLWGGFNEIKINDLI